MMSPKFEVGRPKSRSRVKNLESCIQSVEDNAVNSRCAVMTFDSRLLMVSPMYLLGSETIR